MSGFLSIASLIKTVKVTLGFARPEYRRVPVKKPKPQKVVLPEMSTEEARIIVAGLILQALTRQLCVREALKQFPPDQFDPSIQAAWHALTHFEADEEIRLRDPEYAKEQDEYLEMIAFTLQDGSALPLNIIESYKPYHEVALIPRSTKLKSILKSLMRYTI